MQESLRDRDNNSIYLIVGIPPYTHKHFIQKYFYDYGYVQDFKKVLHMVYVDNKNWLGLIVKNDYALITKL